MTARRSISGVVLAGLLSALLCVPAEAAPPTFKRLGTDSVGDASAGHDITYLDVAASEGVLEVRFGLEGMASMERLASDGSVWWIFNTNQNGEDWTVVADTGLKPRYYMTWGCCYESGGGYIEEYELTGTYNHEEGVIAVYVPLGLLDSPSGTKIFGCRRDYFLPCESGHPNGGTHTHLGIHPDPVATEPGDKFVTIKSFTLP